MTGQEERDMLFARLFGLMSVIRSGLLVRTAPLPTSASSKTEASTLSNCKEVIDQLLSLGEKKSWLRESAWFTIGLAIDALATSEVSWKKEALDFVIEQLFTVTTTWGPEKIALSLKLQELIPERDWQKILTPTFKTPNLLSTSNLQTVSRIMKVCAAHASTTFTHNANRSRQLTRKATRTPPKHPVEPGNLNYTSLGTSSSTNSSPAPTLPKSNPPAPSKISSK